MSVSCPKVSTAVYAFLICLELSSSLVASTWTAFWNDKVVNVWAHVIFVIDIAFALILFYCVSLETCSLGKRNDEQILSPKCLCVICTIGTIGLLSILYYYNKTVLQECDVDSISWIIFLVFVLAYFTLVGVSIYLLWDWWTGPAADNHIIEDNENGGDYELYEILDTGEASDSSKPGERATFLNGVDQFSNKSSQV